MGFEGAVVPTPDGRELEVAAVGDPNGSTIFFHHGTPGSAALARIFEDAATERGYFIVTTSRAGYGLSSRRAGRDVAAVVADVHVALDAYGRGDYVAMGWSGGGPHALACAALDRPRCVATVCLAAVAPSTVDFDWTAGMGPENVEEFALAREGGPRYEEHIKFQRDVLVDATADNIVELMGGLLSEADKVALKDPVTMDVMVEAFAHGLAPGYFGFLDDDQVFMNDWGFPLSRVDGPVDVWFAGEDLMVPATHGRFLADQIVGARPIFLAADGHISLVTNYQAELFDRLDELTASL
jgi:pimeloyl-ACP methyl ester carboxylesterase